jgi:GxxExxY protein
MIIENAIVLELKAVDVVLPVYKKQLLTYLRISHLKLGLLINFNSEHLRDGITRVIN